MCKSCQPASLRHTDPFGEVKALGSLNSRNCAIATKARVSEIGRV
jgi:hypothetical protein